MSGNKSVAGSSQHRPDLIDAPSTVSVANSTISHVCLIVSDVSVAEEAVLAREPQEPFSSSLAGRLLSLSYSTASGQNAKKKSDARSSRRRRKSSDNKTSLRMSEQM